MKPSLLATGIGIGLAACGGLYYYFSQKKKDENQESPISLRELHEVIQYIKYHYFPILEETSKAIRKAKEELKYNDDFASETEQRGSFIANISSLRSKRC